MPINTIPALVEALCACPLLDDQRRRELHEDLAARHTDIPGLSRELVVQRGWLTVYQLKQVLLGRGADLMLGQYEILDLLGEGGMGQVFKARHRRLERIDALKRIHPKRLEAPEVLRRFVREARAAARLAHPNIVAVHDAGEIDGVHFLAMEYVPGVDLSATVKKEGPLPIGAACEYIRQAALGLQHAHSRGLVHRDVKPHNLLLTADRAQVKILDMGLARLKTAEDGKESVSELTRPGAVMGTPDYMAPEQAIDSHTVDIRADVYSLGCTLYYLLAGRPPFPESSLTQKLLWHQQCEPGPLSRPDVPPDLVAVLARMMAKQPERRYQTPVEAAAALAPFAARPSPVSEGPAHQAEEADFSFANPVEAPSQPLAPTGDRPPAEAADFRLGGPAEAVNPAAAPLGDNSTGGRGAPTVHVPRASPLPLRPAALDAALKTPASTRRPADEEEEEEEEEEETPAGKARWLTTAGSVLASVLVVAGGAFGPGLLTRLAAASGREYTHHSDIVYGVAFAPDGLRAASCGTDQKVFVFDLETGMVERRLDDFPNVVNAVAWSPVEDLILTGGKDKLGQPNKSVKLWDINPGRSSRQRSLIGPTAPVMTVAFSPDGKLALTGGGQDRPDLRLWEAASGKPLAKLTGHTDRIFRVAFGPGGGLAASCSRDRTIRIWDVAQCKEIKRIDLSDHALCLAFAPEGGLLASGGQDKTVRLWDLSTCREVFHLTGHQADVLGTAFTPDGRRVVTAGGDKTVRVWDLQARTELKTFVGHTDIVINVAVSPDGTKALSCSQDRTVRLWVLPR